MLPVQNNMLQQLRKRQGTSPVGGQGMSVGAGTGLGAQLRKGGLQYQPRDLAAQIKSVVQQNSPAAKAKREAEKAAATRTADNQRIRRMLGLGTETVLG